MHKQLIIAGFHRSGTSMLAQELNNAGLFIGERLMPPGISNADGHYEDMDFFTFHEKILRLNHTNWQYASDVSLEIPQKCEVDMHRIINTRNAQYDQWGFKDPCSALFLDQWYTHLDSPYTVIIYRHFEECVNSLMHRAAGSLIYDQSSDISFWVDPTLAYRMWLSYNKRIITHVKKYPKTCLVVSHQAILNGFPIAKMVSEKFGFNLNVPAHSAVKKSLLSPQQCQHFTLDHKLLGELEETWQILEGLSLAPSEVPIQNTLSSERKTLENLHEKLEYLEISYKMDNDPISIALKTLSSNDMELEKKIDFIKKQRPLFSKFQKNQLLITSLKSLIVQYPEEVELYFLLSDICIVDKEYDLAELFLLKVFSVTHHVAPFYYCNLSNLYLKKNDLNMAKFYIDKAILGNPKNPFFYVVLSMISYERCEYGPALDKLNKAIIVNCENDNNPNLDLQFHLKKIDLLYELGKVTEVMNIFTYLHEKFPSDEKVERKNNNMFLKKEKLDVIGKIEKLKNRFSVIQNDPYFYAKLISLWSSLDNIWAKEDLLDRMIYHLGELDIKKKTSMKLVMTLLVRDEEDIIRENIEYHLAQGVDFIIATDNRSVDSTKSILKEYEKKGKLLYIYEGDDNYNQHQWVTKMAKIAISEYGADWVINNDADEFWWPKSTSTLKEAFLSIPHHYNIVQAERKNFVLINTKDDSKVFYEQMIFKDLYSLNPLGQPLPPKQAHRGDANVIVDQGNHSVKGIGEQNVIEEIIEIFHFPIRSYHQIENKIIKGGAAYAKNSELPKNIGHTWRKLYEDYLRDGNLNEYFDNESYNDSELKESINSTQVIKDTRLKDFFLNWIVE